MQNIDYSIITTDGTIRNKMISPGEEVNIISIAWT